MKNYYLNGLCLLFINLFFICICSAQWSIVDIGSTDNLYDIHFINKDSGWVAGDNKVYKTEDAGINWIPYNSAVTDTRYYGIHFKNELDGWAVGKKKTSSTAGRVHYTTDGGLTWQVYFTSGSLPWWSVSFSEDGMNGIMVGQEGQSRFTTDGGLNWFPRTLPSGNAGIIKDVTFYDGLNAIAVGYDAGQGVIMKTADSGNSWTDIVTNLEGQLNSVSFNNYTDGIAVGSSGKIYKTSDGGDTWIEKDSNTANTLNGVNFYDENRIIAVGSGGTIVGSSDNGETWAMEDSGTTFTLRNVNKSSVATAYAVGQVGTVVKDNCVQSGTVVFVDNVATPFIAPVLTTESKIYFYYNVDDQENTPPVCTVVEEFISFNGDVVKIGARYLGNGLLQLWLDFSFDETPRNLTISIPDSITEDDISISFDETTRPPDFQIELETRQDVKESINLFAGGSIGLSAIEGGVGIGPATIALAKQTISGSGGMRLKIENDLSGNQIITRSFEFGAGVSAEVPVINSPIPLIKGVPKASIELKGLVGQSMRFNDDSDTTKKAKAAYLIESFGIGGIALNPFAGIYITALKNALVDLNPDLSNLYSTYHYSDISGASAEGGLSVDFSFKYGNTKFDLLEASSSASLSANFEEFMNNKRSLNISYARSFNMSTLDLSILNNTIDFGDQLGYEYGGKIGVTGVYNNQNSQIENLTLSFSGSASPTVSILQISRSKEYKFIIPENVIANNSAVDNIIGVASDLLTLGNSNKTFRTGVDNFTSSLDIIYADNPATLGEFEDHNLLEVNESEQIGIKENIGIDLTAAIGIGIGINLGLEYSYITESKYLQSQHIVANDTILPTFENSRNLDDLITLNGEITNLFEGTTLLLDGAFDELITTIEQPIQDGVDFIIEIGDSTVELAGNLVSDGENWVLRWLNPTYNSSFTRGPVFQTEVRQVYVSRVNQAMDVTTTNFTGTSKLYIVSNNLNSNLLDINNVPVEIFDPVTLSLTMDQDQINELGFTDTEKALAKLYKFDDATLSWIEIDGDTNADLNIISTEITESGNYAIGINYDTALDLTAPDITGFYPTEGSIIPSVDEHWAELFESFTGVGLDLSQTIIKIDDIEVTSLWDPINEKILYTPESPLTDGAHTFEVIVKDLNGNTNSIFSNYIVDSSLSITNISDINSYRIYPNPTKDILNINGNISILESLDIYNIHGQHVKNIRNNFRQIDISDLSPALYFIKLSTNNAQRVIKIIKE